MSYKNLKKEDLEKAIKEYFQTKSTPTDVPEITRIDNKTGMIILEWDCGFAIMHESKWQEALEKAQLKFI
jgi:hypothetical protein